MSITDRVVQLSVFDKVREERDRQDEKWGDEHLDANPHLWLRILTEEVGEVAAEVDHRHYTSNELEEELVQVAAVAVGWLEDIEHQKSCIQDYAKKLDAHYANKTSS